MAPDLNSLPPSPQPAGAAARSPRSMSQDQSHPSPHSLAAAAALNAGLQSDGSRRSSNSSLRDASQARMERRRRSSIRMSLSLNDPAVPGPGELQVSPRASRSGSSAMPGSPHHQRNPSLGELAQQWESESENQVNRLLNMIRQQQATIQSLQNQNAVSATSTVAVEDGTPTSERSISLNPTAPPPTLPLQQSTPTNPVASGTRSPHLPHTQLSRHSSRRSGRSSREASPALRPVIGHHDSSELLLGGSAMRDESTFYVAETQNLTRENQMLKHRIRELERQLNELSSGSSTPHSPLTTSNLHRPPITPSSEAEPQQPAATE